MKKLLILMLVLGMASVANSAIILSFDGDTTQDRYYNCPGDTSVIGIYNTDGEDYIAYVNLSRLSDYSFRMSNPQLTPLAGDLSSVSAPYNYGDSREIEVTLKGTSIPGVQFTWDYTGLDHMDVMVELWDNSDLSAPVDLLSIYNCCVPAEPLTVAFFALGCLFLTRRRR